MKWHRLWVDWGFGRHDWQEAARVEEGALVLVRYRCSCCDATYTQPMVARRLSSRLASAEEAARFTAQMNGLVE